MILPALAALAAILAFAAYLRGYQLGKRAAYREWLEALVADWDDAATMERILEQIRDEA